MQIACKCKKCGHLFVQNEDDLCLEFDFYEETISYVCRNKNCKHENVLDFKSWKKKQEYSPLPQSRMM